MVLVVTFCLCLACAPAPAPVSTPAAPPPTPTLTFDRLPTLSPPTPVGAAASPALPMLPVRYAAPFPPADVPTCSGIQELERLPVRFAWDMTGTKYEDVFANAPLENWTYYRCTGSPAAVVSFYRAAMTLPIWEQHASDERADGTLTIFDNGPVTVSPAFRWVYIWVLPDKTDVQMAYLVLAWWNGPKTC